MADLQNPFDDEIFRDISAASTGGDAGSSMADEAPEKRWQQQASQGFIGRNGHRHPSGPLAPLQVPPTSNKKASEQGNRRKLLPTMLGVIGVVVIVSCLGIGAIITLSLLSFQSGLNGPQTTLNDFYSALHTTNYRSAYDQLSSRYQHELNYNSFQAKYATLDALNGPIQSHQISNLQTQGNSAGAVVKVVRQMQTGATVNQLQTVQLIMENSVWKIDRITPGQTSPG